jgi:hypothetical protein
MPKSVKRVACGVQNGKLVINQITSKRGTQKRRVHGGAWRQLMPQILQFDDPFKKK